MESEYEFESSAFSVGLNGDAPQTGSRLNAKLKSSARQRLLSKIEKPQIEFLKSEKGKSHFLFLKTLVEYLHLVDSLQAIYDSGGQKTLLYLLTLLVNRVENWNSIVLEALKKKTRYFSPGISEFAKIISSGTRPEDRKGLQQTREDLHEVQGGHRQAEEGAHQVVRRGQEALFEEDLGDRGRRHLFEKHAQVFQNSRDRNRKG